MVNSNLSKNLPPCATVSIAASRNLDDCDVNNSMYNEPSNQTFSTRPSENGSFCNTTSLTQRCPFTNPQTCSSDQNNFCTSNSGLSFRSYTKNNGINYSQQQSLLQVSKDVGSVEATIPLKQCKLKSSLSSSGSNSKNTSSSSTVPLDATSSFSSFHPQEHQASTTSGSSRNADKASHDSSRNDSNFGVSSHENITLSKNDEGIEKGEVDKIQFHNNRSESSSTCTDDGSSSNKTCSATAPSISLINLQHQQVARHQQLKNSSKTEMTNLTTIRNSEHVITSLGSGNNGSPTIALQNINSMSSKHLYPPTTVTCNLCEDDTAHETPIKSNFNSPNNTSTPMSTPTINCLNKYNKSCIGNINNPSLCKDVEKSYKTKTYKNVSYDQSTTMEFSNSMHNSFNPVLSHHITNYQERQAFHGSTVQSKSHGFTDVDETYNSKRCKNIQSSQNSSLFNSTHHHSIHSSFQDHRNSNVDIFTGN